jgi:transcriptional regulator with XRE-family HTH domain
MSALANFVKKRMGEVGVTQKELTDIHKIPKGTVSRFLNGQVKDHELPTFVVFSEVLQVPLWRLLEAAGYEIERPTDPAESDRRLARQIEATPELRPIVQWLFDLDMDDRVAVEAFVEAWKRRHGEQDQTPL